MLKPFFIHITQKLKHRNKQKVYFTVCLFAGLFFYFSLPKKLFTSPTSYVIEDGGGNLLNASIATDGQWRFPYNKNVPAHFTDCITTFED
ncbi:MAG TPA: hypothetical protein VLR49_01890, partial [Ferruginibacter sp.]|nr:hypothetical protein [Ferruginibacter sp.]